MQMSRVIGIPGHALIHQHELHDVTQLHAQTVHALAVLRCAVLLYRVLVAVSRLKGENV